MTADVVVHLCYRNVKSLPNSLPWTPLSRQTCLWSPKLAFKKLPSNPDMHPLQLLVLHPLKHAVLSRATGCVSTRHEADKINCVGSTLERKSCPPYGSAVRLTCVCLTYIFVVRPPNNVWAKMGKRCSGMRNIGLYALSYVSERSTLVSVCSSTCQT